MRRGAGGGISAGDLQDRLIDLQNLGLDVVAGRAAFLLFRRAGAMCWGSGSGRKGNSRGIAEGLVDYEVFLGHR